MKQQKLNLIQNLESSKNDSNHSITPSRQLKNSKDETDQSDEESIRSAFIQNSRAGLSGGRRDNHPSRYPDLFHPYLG